MIRFSPWATAILAATLAPAAWAEVCDKMVPESATDVFVMFLPELILAAIVATAILADGRTGLLAAAALLLAYTAFYLAGSADDVQAAARAEGCAAPLFVVPAVAGALVTFLVARGLRRSVSQRSGP